MIKYKTLSEALENTEPGDSIFFVYDGFIVRKGKPKIIFKDNNRII